MASRTEYCTQTPNKPSLFDVQYLRNHRTLHIGVLGYIGIVWPKEHSPEVRSFPPGTPCIYTHTHFISASKTVCCDTLIRRERLLDLLREIWPSKTQITSSVLKLSWHSRSVNGITSTFKLPFGNREKEKGRSVLHVCACVMCSRSTAQLSKRRDIRIIPSSNYCNKHVCRIRVK